MPNTDTQTKKTFPPLGRLDTVQEFFFLLNLLQSKPHVGINTLGLHESEYYNPFNVIQVIIAPDL